MAEKYVKINIKRLVDMLEYVSTTLHSVSEDAESAHREIEGYLEDIYASYGDDLAGAE